MEDQRIPWISVLRRTHTCPGAAILLKINLGLRGEEDEEWPSGEEACLFITMATGEYVTTFFAEESFNSSEAGRVTLSRRGRG
jgi:hypothetical protein